MNGMSDSCPDPALSPPVPALPTLGPRLLQVFKSNLSKLEKYVLLYLCFAADGSTGKQWRSVKTMCADLSMSRSALLSILTRLIKRGCIERHRRQCTSAITQLRPQWFVTATAPAREPGPWRRPAKVHAQDPSPPAERPTRSPTETQSVRVSVRESGGESSTGDDLTPLYAELRNTYPDLTEKQFFWAVRQVEGRARTPPQHIGYWRKSLPRFFENLTVEVMSYLVETAVRLREQGVGADIASELYEAALVHDLDCGRGAIQDAIDAADARFARAATLASELRVGGSRA